MSVQELNSTASYTLLLYPSWLLNIFSSCYKHNTALVQQDVAISWQR